MALLHDGVGQQDGERNDSACEQSHEDKVRPGLRNQAYHYGQQDHQGGVVTDPSRDVNEIEQETDDQKHPESPKEYARKVLADNVFPKMFLDKMIGGEKQGGQHDNAQRTENPESPLLIEDL